MGDLTNNFSRAEFACRCGCGFSTADHQLVTMLQAEADYFGELYGAPVYIDITGPNRCADHNDSVGGEPRSTHKEAKAADHKVFVMFQSEWQQIPALEQYDYLDKTYPTSCGLGIYDNRCHLDSRTAKARWDKRTDRSA